MGEVWQSDFRAWASYQSENRILGLLGKKTPTKCYPKPFLRHYVLPLTQIELTGSYPHVFHHNPAFFHAQELVF